MENQNFYEGRILVNMAASVMRQDESGLGKVVPGCRL